MNPINWWHQQEGGEIAKQRPAPPGASQPYPNLSAVPPKPAPADQQALKQLTDSLVADRTNAQHAAQSAPLADPSSPSASPGLFGVGTAPPPPPASTAPPASSGSPGTSVASASMPAVTAPPPSPAPRKPVESAPLEAPPTQTAAAQAPAAQTPAAQTPVAQTPAAQTPASAATANAATPPANVAAAGPVPVLPAAPPARPADAGSPPVAPVLPAPMPETTPGPSATIVFLQGASNLSQPATDEVKAFAAKRGKGSISVIGYGDSVSSDPDAQSAALNLGLSRAQSIVDALKADGVPSDAIRVSAEASGRGAALHLIQ